MRYLDMRLGLLYIKGEIMDKNVEKAFVWLIVINLFFLFFYFLTKYIGVSEVSPDRVLVWPIGIDILLLFFYFYFKYEGTSSNQLPAKIIAWLAILITFVPVIILFIIFIVCIYYIIVNIFSM